MEALDKQPTCEERIDAELASRVVFLGDLAKLARGAEDRDALKRLQEEGEIDIDETDWLEIQDRAIMRADETPLAVSRKTVWRIELSYGGPQDYFDVFVSDGEVERIEYRFLDWFDGASRVVSGDEFDALEDYARQVTGDFYAGE